MVKSKCYLCVFYEKEDNLSGWGKCNKKDLRIHWNWAVNPPIDDLKNCKEFINKEKKVFRCYNDSEIFKQLKK